MELPWTCQPSYGLQIEVLLRSTRQRALLQANKGQRFIQLEPLEFLDKLAALIPLPHRHRRHYHGVFAPNSPLRKKVAAHAKQRIGQGISHSIQKVVAKTERVSLDWAALIARIYEVNPLICSKCGNNIKISGFVTHKAEIYRILRGLAWPIQLHEFDPSYEIRNRDLCQLNFETEDGFSEPEVQVHCDIGPDPPSKDSNNDPPNWVDMVDPPHMEDAIDTLHLED